ncbi:hypothetical protein ACPSVR_003932 [Yersinia enterocolitica]
MKLNAVGGGFVGANSVWRAQIPESKKPAIKLVSLNMVPDSESPFDIIFM